MFSTLIRVEFHSRMLFNFIHLMFISNIVNPFEDIKKMQVSATSMWGGLILFMLNKTLKKKELERYSCCPVHFAFTDVVV